MKAIIQDRYGGPEHLRLADIPVPEPVRSQIRVRVLACAVNLSDWEYLIGSPLYARLVGGLMKPKRQVLGSDIVGVVDKLGPNVTGLPDRRQSHGRSGHGSAVGLRNMPACPSPRWSGFRMGSPTRSPHVCRRPVASLLRERKDLSRATHS